MSDPEVWRLRFKQTHWHSVFLSVDENRLILNAPIHWTKWVGESLDSLIEHLDVFYMDLSVKRLGTVNDWSE